MAKQSIKELVKEQILSEEAGTILFAQNFVEIAGNEQVRLALSRLAKEKFLIRVGPGMYVHPKNDPLIGPVRPGLEQIAEAIAKRDQLTIKPTGAYALNRLGLSTQVPTKVIYLTNGESRKIRVGKNTISFKKTTPKRMAYRGFFTPLVIEAMQELGPKSLTPELKKQLQEFVTKDDPQQVKVNATLAPVWIGEILISMLKNNTHV